MKMDFRDFKMMLMFFFIGYHQLTFTCSSEIVSARQRQEFPFFFLLENISLLKRLVEPSPHEHTIWFLLVETKDRQISNYDET